jgi:hypothetical protein
MLRSIPMILLIIRGLFAICDSDRGQYSISLPVDFMRHSSSVTKSRLLCAGSTGSSAHVSWSTPTAQSGIWVLYSQCKVSTLGRESRCRKFGRSKTPSVTIQYISSYVKPLLSRPRFPLPFVLNKRAATERDPEAFFSVTSVSLSDLGVAVFLARAGSVLS